MKQILISLGKRVSDFFSNISNNRMINGIGSFFSPMISIMDTMFRGMINILFSVGSFFKDLSVGILKRFFGLYSTHQVRQIVQSEIQKLKTENTELKSKVASLEAKIDQSKQLIAENTELKSKVASLEAEKVPSLEAEIEQSNKLETEKTKFPENEVPSSHSPKQVEQTLTFRQPPNSTESQSSSHEFKSS